MLNIITEIENKFNEIIRRLNMTTERINDFKDKSIKLPILKCNEENERKVQNIQELEENLKTCNKHTSNWNIRWERKTKRSRRNI